MDQDAVLKPMMKPGTRLLRTNTANLIAKYGLIVCMDLLKYLYAFLLAYVTCIKGSLRGAPAESPILSVSWNYEPRKGGLGM